MNTQVLIDSIVRQVTVLIAQLATSGGLRAPLAHLANQVFVELANELAAQGVSRKVSADMFGMALRAYTYSFDLWPGHPLEAEVKGRLAAIRAECGALRQRVEAINAASPLAIQQQVVVYAGQCLLEMDSDGAEEGDGHENA